MKVRIGTRGSELALWQAHHVAHLLSREAETEIIVIKTRGDAIDSKPLQLVEGKAFFTAEIEQALLDDEVDLAVHSHKDLATESPEGLAVAAVPARGPAAERLLVRPERHDPTAGWLPLVTEANVGTSSPRRAAQLKALRGDLTVSDLRGNVPTRVRRLREQRFDAIVLAEAGLVRLELDTTDLVDVPLPPALLVPAPAQGALAIQTRADDERVRNLCRRILHDQATAEIVAAERSLLVRFGGGCHLPLGVHVERSAAGEALPFHARAFLGADLPVEGAPSRWGEAHGASPGEAADAVHRALASGEATGTGPLRGVSIVLVGSSDDGTTLGQRLEQLGAAVHHEKVLAFQDVGAPDLPAKLARLKRGDVLALTSQEAARRLSGERVPPGVVVAAVGPATARALAAVGLRTDLVGEGGARELAARIEVPEGGTVLFPCAEESRPDLPEALAARGVHVEKVVLYRTVSEAASPPVASARVRVYMSPSAVLSSVSLGREGGEALRIGLGGATSDTLQDEGLPHERPSGSGPGAVVALLARVFGGADDPTGTSPRATTGGPSRSQP